MNKKWRHFYVALWDNHVFTSTGLASRPFNSVITVTNNSLKMHSQGELLTSCHSLIGCHVTRHDFEGSSDLLYSITLLQYALSNNLFNKGANKYFDLVMLWRESDEEITSWCVTPQPRYQSYITTALKGMYSWQQGEKPFYSINTTTYWCSVIEKSGRDMNQWLNIEWSI